MLYKAILTLHFLAMIAAVGGVAAASVLLTLVERGGPAEGSVYGRALVGVNGWLLLPGLAVAPVAGLWLWSRHGFVLPGWLQYKLGLTLLGIIAGAMYLHLFRSELGPLLRNRVPAVEGTGEATASCRRVLAAAGLLLVAAAVIGTLKPGW